VHRIRVDERDLQAEKPAPRALVDQLRPLSRELVQRRANVVDLVGDVVHPRTAVGEELADRGLLAERGKQFDPVAADPEGRGFDPLFGNGLAVLEPGAEEPLVRRERRVEIVDRDAEVMNPARLHAGDAIGWSVGRDDPDGADRLGSAGLGLDVGEQRGELVLVERLLVEQLLGDAVERGAVLL
jgi:hypothetical protein